MTAPSVAERLIAEIRYELCDSVEPSSRKAALLEKLDRLAGYVGVNNHAAVGNFHQKFGLDNTTFGGIGPRPWDDDLIEFRIKFLSEELDEFRDAALVRDHAKMADALVDLNYVSHGTAHLLGYPWHLIFGEVQRANMAKQRARCAEDSTRGSTFDVIKPPGWTAPDVAGILRTFGWEL